MIDFTNDSIQFNNYSEDRKNYIDTKTGKTNFIIDIE